MTDERETVTVGADDVGTIDAAEIAPPAVATFTVHELKLPTPDAKEPVGVRAWPSQAETEDDAIAEVVERCKAKGDDLSESKFAAIPVEAE